MITEFVEKYGFEWVQSHPGKVEHVRICRYNGNGGRASALTRFD